MEANIGYSCGCILLVFLTDLSGIGPALMESDHASRNLAVLQAAAFLGPTLNQSLSAGYDLRRTFSLNPCSLTSVGAAAVGGASLWALLATATALRGGVGSVGVEAAYQLAEASAALWAAPTDAGGWAELLGYGALAPALVEEALFRGYLLTALRSGRGGLRSIDAAALSAFLFACFHLSASQFFPTAVLGLATGAVVLSTRSLLPAVALHAAHNAAALAYGAAVLEGSLPPGPPVAGVTAAAVAGAAGSIYLLWSEATADERATSDAD